MNIDNLDHEELALYTTTQIQNLFPSKNADHIKNQILKHLPNTIVRFIECVNSIKCWRNDYFDILHSSQYCTYLYFLSNTIWRAGGDVSVCTKIFLLNKALNGIDCFYEISLPKHFFIGHSIGIVLAKADYGDYLVLYQNSTIGKNHGIAPKIGSKVILYPNSAVIGRSEVGDLSVISQGASVINTTTPGNSMVFQAEGNKLIFKPLKHNIIEDIFHF